MPISSDKHLDYAKEVCQKLLNAGIRATVTSRAESLNYEIREAELQKIPYMLVLGNREQENQAVSVRSYKLGDLKSMSLEKFIDSITNEIKERAIESCFKELAETLKVEKTNKPQKNEQPKKEKKEKKKKEE